MDSILGAVDSLTALLSVLTLGSAIAGTVLAIMLGAFFASSLVPFDASDSESMRSWEKYEACQARLATVRARRRAACADKASQSTRKVECEDTQVDLSCQPVPIFRVIGIGMST